MSAPHSSLQDHPFRDNLKRASFKYCTKALEITTRQWCPLFRDGNSAVANRAPLHLSFTTNYPHNGHFLWMKGQAGLGGSAARGRLRVGVEGENGTRGWQCCSECVSYLESSGRAPPRDRAKACASDTLNVDYVTLYTAPPEFRGSGSFILWILWMSGLFSGRAEHGCFRLFLHAGAERRLLFWSYGNHGINHSVM